MKIELNFKDLKKNYDKKFERKLNDMPDRFKNSKVKGNPLLYTVYIRDYVTFEVALTVIEPGTVNGEFYMTKGHKHDKSRKEIYILTSGSGKLLIQGKKAQSIDIKKNKMYEVPKKSGHRAINTGRGRMEFLSIYSKGAGHNYNFKFTKRFFKK